MNNIIKSKNWLSESALPLWKKNGFEETTGCFIESIDFNSKPQIQSDRRAMVQARQIYSFCEAERLNLINSDLAKDIVSKNVSLLITKYKNINGSYNQSLNYKLEVQNSSPELYTQAFVIFGLAQAYSLLKDKNLIVEALQVLNYLKTERRNLDGGYTELKNDAVLFQSNPHMHLFEAALAWCSLDNSPQWTDLANELKDLCLHKFRDKKTGLIAEHFNSSWQPNIIDENGFIFEPGHQYEWSWLFLEYQRIFKTDMMAIAESLYKNADQFGLSENKSLTYDEIYSNLTIKKNSARFWPQCERIKTAVYLGQLCKDEGLKNQYFQSADLAFDALFEYLNTDIAGLWYDTRSEDGTFNTEQPAKASSLYHITNALSEYISKRNSG